MHIPSFHLRNSDQDMALGGELLYLPRPSGRTCFIKGQKCPRIDQEENLVSFGTPTPLISSMEAIGKGQYRKPHRCRLIQTSPREAVFYPRGHCVELNCKARRNWKDEAFVGAVVNWGSRFQKHSAMLLPRSYPFFSLYRPQLTARWCKWVCHSMVCSVRCEHGYCISAQSTFFTLSTRPSLRTSVLLSWANSLKPWYPLE